MKLSERAIIVLDDGEFVIDMNETEFVITSIDGESAAGPGAGFLYHRCEPEPLAQAGLERIGQYFLRNGKWAVAINRIDTLFRLGPVPSVALFQNRLDAINTLWTARRDAWLLHI
jgi:hypothetical protein